MAAVPPLPRVTTQEEWLDERRKLLAREREVAEARDALTAERRRLPMVEIVKGYAFEAPEGTFDLLDLFERRRQLIVYHFWFEPESEPCGGCSRWVNNLGHIAGLYENDTSMAMVSRAPSVEIEEVKARRGWTVPWFSLVGEDFNVDAGYAGEPQITVFLRDADTVFRTYSTSGRVLETIGNEWTLLDLTPLNPSN